MCHLLCVSSYLLIGLHISLMMKGRNSGKKLLAVRIVAHAFEIIHLLTDQNPIQVSCLAVCNDVSILSFFDLPRYWLMLLLTPVPEKTPPVSARKELSVVRLLMCPLCDESTSRSR